MRCHVASSLPMLACPSDEAAPSADAVASYRTTQLPPPQPPQHTHILISPACSRSCTRCHLYVTLRTRHLRILVVATAMQKPRGNGRCHCNRCNCNAHAPLPHPRHRPMSLARHVCVAAYLSEGHQSQAPTYYPALSEALRQRRGATYNISN